MLIDTHAGFSYHLADFYDVAFDELSAPSFSRTSRSASTLRAGQL